MVIALTIVFSVLGLIIGSFLNVVILRLNTQKSLGGRSACMSCQKTLCWYELIPFFSFIALRGRCKTCKTKISIQYPLVEIAAGFVFGLLFWKFQNIFFDQTISFSLVYGYYAILFSLLIAIVTYDIKHKIIPDVLSFVFGLISFLGIFIFDGYVFYPHIPTFLELLSGIIIAVPFALLWLFSKGEWMGLGDAKLMLGMGFMLGLEKALSSLVIAFWSGAIFGVIFMVINKKDLKTEIPFAPFLVLGTLLAFFLDIFIFRIF
jgi:prepilin signal peptidase PulO-like enzyme (type II secretory pathway)